jgi:PAS domain S-box-containing protein
MSQAQASAFGHGAILHAAILANSAYGIIATDTQGLITVFNPAAEAMLGYSASEVVGQLTPAPFHLPDEVVARAISFSAELNESIVPGFDVFIAKSRRGLPNEHEWTYVRKDGSRFDVLLSITPLIGTAGTTDGYLGMIADLSEKRRQQASFQLVQHFADEQSQFLQVLLEALPIPVFYKDRSGRYLGANRAYLSFLGVTREDYVGKTPEEIWRPDLAARYRAADDALYANPDEIQVYESHVVSAGGEKRDVIFQKACFRDSLQNVSGLIGTLQDVTSLRRAEVALRESEGRLKQVMQGSPLPIFVLDETQKIVLWNPACERWFGFSAEEMLGSADPWRVFYPSPRPVLANLIVAGGDEGVIRGYYGDSCRRSAFNPEAFESEAFFPHMGEQGGRWLYFSASPLRNADGKVIGAVETLIDITERKLAEAEAGKLTEELEIRVEARTAELAHANEDLKRAMKQLVHAEKLAALGDLVAGVAHELNTPIGNMLTMATAFHGRVKGFSNAVLNGGLRRSVLESFVQGANEASESIERNAGRAADLISTFKQVAVDQTSVRRRKFDLADLMRDVSATLQPRLKLTPHRLMINVPAGIGLDSYPGPLDQVMMNLVNNALLHAFCDDISGTMSITARLDGPWVEIEFSDNGMGMDAATAARAFEPFFTTRLGSGGSGLGLYLVYNLVTAALDGDISMHSELDAGTRFLLKLPLIAKQHQAEEKVFYE